MPVPQVDGMGKAVLGEGNDLTYEAWGGVNVERRRWWLIAFA